MIRYAEVLLNYAEAEAELGTFTDDDWSQMIAELRKRAGVTDVSMPTTLDIYLRDNFYSDGSSIPLMEIRLERDIELAAEGFRYTGPGELYAKTTSFQFRTVKQPFGTG